MLLMIDIRFLDDCWAEQTRDKKVITLNFINFNSELAPYKLWLGIISMTHTVFNFRVI